MSHKNKIKEAFPELEQNSFIMELAEDLDNLSKISSFAETEAGQHFIKFLRQEISEKLQTLIASVEKPEKEKDALIISIKEKLSLLMIIQNTKSDAKELQETIDKEIKATIG